MNTLEMAEDKYGVDIQPLIPHSDAIVYLGQDNKVNVNVGRSVPLASAGKQSAIEIVVHDQRVVAADQY